MPLKGTVKVLTSGVEYSKAGDLGAAIFALTREYGTWKITSGVGVDQADLLFSDQRTLGAGANEDLDLAGALLDIYGASLTFVKLRRLVLRAADANPNNLTLSRPASNGIPLFIAASDGLIIPPGCSFAWQAPKNGISVTAGTGDLLNVLAGAGGNHVYDIEIIGTSA
jgi:hypothetical protein